ncbi:MAG: hypothetical protein H7263_18660, partial [Candidatus Sericytochromatia bacterium]|nr:hypothetical protein [Candidatus Sericytochromatia bacterium]
MKSITKKSLLLLLVNSLLFACTTQNNIPIQANKNNEINSNYSTVGNVKFNFDFPAKFNTNNPELKKAFGVKAIEVGKINRVKVRVESATTSYVIERNVELVPGGVEATLSLPLDKLYTITVQGLNDTESVSGAEIKGYFSLMSSSIVPNVTVNQVTTPVAKIIEGLKARIIAQALNNTKNPSNALPASSPSIAPSSGTTQKSPDPVVSGSPTTASPSPSSSPNNIPSAAPTPTLSPSFAPSPIPVDLTKVLVTPEGQFRLANIDTAALYEVVNRARGAAHPSLINVDSFVNSIFTNQIVPVEVPQNPLLKTGTIKGKVSGLKYNEVAVVTVNDPASKQTIVVTPSQISLSTDTNIDPDKISPDISYEVDNVTPGNWNVSIVSSGYTADTKATTTNKGTSVKSDAVSSFDFKLLAAQWPKTPINVSGSLGTSDQANLALDEVGSIHTVWRQ